jgi:aldehyde:ferredoxin oxidoreductase
MFPEQIRSKKMIGGIHGKILHIDLTSGQTRIEQPGDDFYRLLVGGRALVAYFLLRDLPPRTDPLGPDNLLIFAPGIMQGTNLPGSGRHGVGAKSPLTGALGTAEKLLFCFIDAAVGPDGVVPSRQNTIRLKIDF